MNYEQMIHIFPGGTDTCSSKLAEDLIARQGWWCRICRRARPDTSAVDFQIADAKPMHSPISSAVFWGISISRRDFIERLIEKTSKSGWFIGHLLGPDGCVLSDWVTFNHQDKAIVRGDKHVSFRICEECGNILYFATGKRHVLKSDVIEKQVVDTGLGGLLMREGLFQSISKEKFKSIDKEVVQVVDEALDGLGTLGRTHG